MSEINKVLCGVILPLFLLGAGLFFAIKLKFFYIFKPIKAIKSMVGCRGGFSSLCVALAGTLGVGNIVGVASAILGGGYGSIFWMWVSAIFSMSLKYAEVVLAMKHRKIKSGKYYGGAPYYIYEGFLKKCGKKASFILASAFAVLCTINSLTTGNLVQANAISGIFKIPKFILGLLFTTFAVLVVCRGIKRISKFTSVLIPVLSVFYICICTIILIKNISSVPYAFKVIFESAFNLKSASFGVLGFGISRAIRYGISRGLLSNEAGSGTAPCAHASSNAENAHSQGCLGIFEVFFDTIVLCTLTALVIIISGVFSSENAMDLVLDSFELNLGSIGRYGVLISCLLFSFATVITQYFYGKESLSFISRSKIFKIAFTVLFFLVTFVSFLIPMSVMWEIADLVLAIMTIFNLACLLLLHKQI
ncbi:MAG: sodium:alanine symporter family protein [Clostridia bacterium]|nr:sodium:alanine symporter family protein [Clostridia bacterium]